MESIPKKSGIYQIRNLVNGKIYIGSAVNLHARWQKHSSCLRHNKHCNIKLQNAYNKYGKDNIVFEVVELVPNKEQLLDREQYYIDTLNTVNEGYNICPIAGNTTGVFHTEETIQKMKIAHSNISEETRRRMSEAGKRRGPLSEETKRRISKTLKGKTLSSTHRENLSKALKGRCKGVYTGSARYNAKSVMCIETGVIYGAISEASRETHTDRTAIIRCVRGIGKTAGGYHWKYAN